MCKFNTEIITITKVISLFKSIQLGRGGPYKIFGLFFLITNFEDNNLGTFKYYISKNLICRRHSQMYRFVCQNCDRGFPDKQYLNDHVCGVSTAHKKRMISSTGDNKCFYIKCNVDIRNRHEEEDHLFLEHFQVSYIGLLRT